MGRIVVLSAADKSQVLSTAWRSVQRQIVREAIARGDGPAGLKLARALAMATYRSAVEFELRFGGAPVREADRFRFPIEEYLFARGDDYVQKYRAETFLALSESIDLHQMDATQVHTPATLIAVREDQLVPFHDMQALAARLNGPRQLIEINSIFGHDAFLKEGAALTPIIKQAIAEHAHEQGQDQTSAKIPGHALGARRARIRRAVRLGRAADLPVDEFCVRRLPPAAQVRLHALRQSDARSAGAPRSRIWRAAPARW